MAKTQAVVEDHAPGVPKRSRGLFQTEAALRVAFDALATADPDCNLTPEEADAYIAQYVDRDTAIAERDRFADFVCEMDAFADAKDDQAAILKRQATAIREGLGRMKASAIKTMQRLGIDEIKGVKRWLKIKHSRGAVEIVNEAHVPDEYWRVREDDDLDTIDKMYSLVDELVRIASPSHSSISVRVKTDALTLLQRARQRRRVIDKVAIQEAWKENGGRDMERVHISDVPDEVVDAARLLGRVLVDGSGQEEAIERPLVPGAVKNVTVSLEIK